MRSAPFLAGLVVALGVTVFCAPQAFAQAEGNAARGAAYAAEHCAKCHGIGAGDKASPVPGLAPFRVIANTPGMTGTAVAVWLRTPHKTMPNLIIEAGDRADLIAYIVSLRGAGETK